MTTTPPLVATVQSATRRHTLLDRARTALAGVATGDAIGKQGDALATDEVRSWYPDGIRGFEGALATPMARWAGYRHVWLFGEWTDDTEQTICVARSLLSTGGRAEHRAVAIELFSCRKSLHKTCSIRALHDSRDPDRVVFEGGGVGAAMRIMPVAILAARGLADPVDAAFETSIPTHGCRAAIASAAAVCNAATAALTGASTDAVLSAALAAAKEARKFRPDDGGVDCAQELSRLWAAYEAGSIEAAFPSDPRELQPATLAALAIVLGATAARADEAILYASNSGGDADTLASIAGGIAGARCPGTVPTSWIDAVTLVNGENIIAVADALVALGD